MTLSEILGIDYPVSEATVSKLLAVAERVEVRKKQFIIEQGKRAGGMFFILDGLFRGVHYRDGQEETLLFATDGDPFTAIHSLARDEPAPFSWQALECSHVLAIGIADFRRLLDSEQDLLCWWSRALLDELYVLERRYVWIGNTDASQRYETLLKIRPEIINRIPVKYIAQYLNIKPETLSRIRAKFAKQ